MLRERERVGTVTPRLTTIYTSLPGPGAAQRLDLPTSGPIVQLAERPLAHALQSQTFLGLARLQKCSASLGTKTIGVKASLSLLRSLLRGEEVGVLTDDVL